MIQNNRLIEKIDNIDYTHLLGYPSEVVAAEVMSMVKDVVRDHMDKVVERLEGHKIKGLDKSNPTSMWMNTGLNIAIEIVKGGGIDG